MSSRVGRGEEWVVRARANASGSLEENEPTLGGGEETVEGMTPRSLIRREWRVFTF
jgi:hypothetical protein